MVMTKIFSIMQYQYIEWSSLFLFNFRLYDRAIKASGTDFRSDKLWDSYISWEKDLPNVTTLHDRVMNIPTQLYSHHFERLEFF